MHQRIIIITSIIILLYVSCGPQDSVKIILDESMCSKHGRLVPDGEIPTPFDLALDTYCAGQLIKKYAPNGVITIFGSTRAREGMRSYDNIRTFARLWTKEMGSRYPILTGGGPGIMEAGNRGAREANGVSLSFSTYFHGGAEKLNSHITDGYMFASFSQREAEMIDRAAAIVIAPGGFGTEWEIFETLTKIQTGKIKRAPVILLGERKVWLSLINRIQYLKKIRTISTEDSKIPQIAETPQKAIEIIKVHLSSLSVKK